MHNESEGPLPAIGWDRVGVLAMVPDDWSAPWQRRHQILSRLARYCPVAWIAPALPWRELVSRRFSHRLQGAEYPSPGEQLFVLAAAADLPTVNAPRFLRERIVRRRAKRGARWLRRQGRDSIEVQIWLPELAAALDCVDYTTSSYHIDDEYSWSSVDLPMSVSERALIERVDRVYVTSPKLLERKSGVNANMIVSPNGVDVAHFAAPRREPSDMADIPHPRIGYVGILKGQLDWELISALAATHADWSFVFVGPTRATHHLDESLAALASRSNVHLLGERSVTALPAYVQAMDVAMLPYRRDAYTDAIDPLKLYEALAAGVPVVAARIRTLLEFSSVVSLAEGASDWSAAILRSLSSDATSAACKASRQAVAGTRDWNTIVDRLATSIAEAFDRSRIR